MLAPGDTGVSGLLMLPFCDRRLLRRRYGISNNASRQPAIAVGRTSFEVLYNENQSSNMSRVQNVASQMSAAIIAAAQPRRIILFGSHASGNAAADSDFDLMVVEDRPVDRYKEMVRLRGLLRSFGVPLDLLVVSEEKYQYWRDTPGNVYYEAATKGITLYEAA
jgi:uncharacterized protein